MQSRASQNAVTLGAQIVVGLIVLTFTLVAFAFVVFGLNPTGYDPSTGETTYRFIGQPFQMDRAISEMFAISMQASRVVSHLVVASLSLLIATFFIQLFLILGSTRRSDPFSRVNAKRLFRMGWIALFVVAVKMTRLLVVEELIDSGQVVQSLLSLAVGLSFLTIGHVFRLGTTMRDDLEGTV